MGRLGRIPMAIRLPLGLLLLVPFGYIQYMAWSGQHQFEQFQQEQHSLAESARSRSADDHGPTYEQRMQAEAERRHAERLAFEQSLAERSERSHAARPLAPNEGMGMLKRVTLASSLVGALALGLFALLYAARSFLSSPDDSLPPDADLHP